MTSYETFGSEEKAHFPRLDAGGVPDSHNPTSWVPSIVPEAHHGQQMSTPDISNLHKESLSLIQPMNPFNCGGDSPADVQPDESKEERQRVHIELEDPPAITPAQQNRF